MARFKKAYSIFLIRLFSKYHYIFLFDLMHIHIFSWFSPGSNEQLRSYTAMSRCDFSAVCSSSFVSTFLEEYSSNNKTMLCTNPHFHSQSPRLRTKISSPWGTLWASLLLSCFHGCTKEINNSNKIRDLPYLENNILHSMRTANRYNISS